MIRGVNSLMLIVMVHYKVEELAMMMQVLEANPLFFLVAVHGISVMGELVDKIRGCSSYQKNNSHPAGQYYR